MSTPVTLLRGDTRQKHWSIKTIFSFFRPDRPTRVEGASLGARSIHEAASALLSHRCQEPCEISVDTSDKISIPPSRPCSTRASDSVQPWEFSSSWVCATLGAKNGSDTAVLQAARMLRPITGYVFDQQ